jgi:6-phosphogluconolactonase (cycloisomerase 2 family)
LPIKKFLYFSLTAMLILAVTLSGYGGGKVTGAEATRYFAYAVHANQSYVSCYSIDAGTGDMKVITEVVSAKAASGVQSITAEPSGRFVYVANRGSKTISAFSINPATGALTKITGSPFAVGNLLNDITVDPTGKYLFVTTDVTSTGRNVYGYSINAATGALTVMIGSPYVAGFSPLGMAFDPSGRYFYVVNYGSKTISAFTINSAANLLTPNFACAYSSSWPVAIVTVKPPAPPLLPDLVITSATVTSRTDTQVNYAYTIKNIGGGAIPSLYNVGIQNFYSADTVFNNSGDVGAGSSNLGIDRPLAPGESYSGTFVAYGAVPAGMNYLTFKIDSENTIAESDETNNTSALSLSLLPDLVITSVVITFKTDTGLDYSYTIKNIGDGTFPSQQDVRVLSYYSANTIPDDSGDVYAYGFLIRLDHSLAPGESYSGTFWTSGAAPAGMNYLTFKMSLSIAESDQTNNTFAVLIP